MNTVKGVGMNQVGGQTVGPPENSWIHPNRANSGHLPARGHRMPWWPKPQHLHQDGLPTLSPRVGRTGASGGGEG